MKIISRILTGLLYLVVLILILSAIGSAILKQPLLLTVIRSNSMYPVWERGDMVLIGRITGTGTIHTSQEDGDVILFKAPKGELSNKGWIMHRAITGNDQNGYVTRGDANNYFDQDEGGTPRIEREWIAGKALTIANTPIVIPLIGHIPLLVEELKPNPFLLPGIALVLLSILLTNSIIANNKKRKKGKADILVIYFLGGIALLVMLSAVLLKSSQHFTVEYEVSKDASGVIQGSAVGIIKVGDKVNKQLAEIGNGSFIPMIATVTSHDSQISFDHQLTRVNKGDKIAVNFSVEGISPGKYRSSIDVGLFYPVLPQTLIYKLSKISYWLALVMVSLVPSLPILLYPLFDSRLRRKIQKALNRKLRFIKRLIPS